MLSVVALGGNALLKRAPKFIAERPSHIASYRCLLPYPKLTKSVVLIKRPSAVIFSLMTLT